MRIKVYSIGNSNATYLNIDHIKFTEIESIPEVSGFPDGNQPAYFKVLLCLGRDYTEKFEAYRQNTVNNPLNPVVNIGSSFETEEEGQRFIEHLFRKDEEYLKNLGYIIINNKED